MPEVIATSFVKRCFLLFTIALTVQHLFGQKETSEWFLYPDKHYTFSGTGPVDKSPSPVFIEGTGASICDSAGNLLLFTSTTGSFNSRVYDRKYNLLPYFKSMDIFLRADNPNVFFVRRPGYPQQYYLFYSSVTSDGLGHNSSMLQYSLIDLSLNNGYGDVISADVKVDSAISYGFTISRKDRSEDFWLVTHKPGTDHFNTWLVDPSGIASSPVESVAGQNPFKEQYRFDEMKTSPNGKIIAGTTHFVDYADAFLGSSWFIEVFDFDEHSGKISSRVRSINYKYVNAAFSHLEFSPDNRLVYAYYIGLALGLQPCGYGAGDLYQYNLCYKDSISFSNYAQRLGSSFSFCDLATWGQVQIAADKKIYFPYQRTGTMSSIQSPNRIGSSANYTFSTSYMQNGNGGNLPLFYHAYTEKAVKNNIVYSGFCYPTPLTFEITNDSIANIQWNFGDPASGVNNTSTSIKAPHAFSAPGKYLVAATLYDHSGNLIESISDSVEIKDSKRRLLEGLPKDTAICRGSAIPFQQSVINGFFYWTVRNTQRLYVIGSANNMQLGEYGEGTYIVEMHQNDCDGCILTDSITIHFLETPYVSLGYDRQICTGDSTLLYTENPGSVNVWSTGDTTESIWVKKAGDYSIRSEYNNNGCVIKDTIHVGLKPPVVFNLPADTTLCNNETLLLAPGIADATYWWQNNTAAEQYLVTKPGKYWVTIMNNYLCSASDTVNVVYVNAAAVNLGKDTSLCTGDSLRLQVTVPGSNYQWSTGSTTDNIVAKNSDDYWVQVNNGVCVVKDTIHINFRQPPIVHLGNDTALCDKTELLLDATAANSIYIWQDHSANDHLNVTGPGQYWVKLNQQGCVSSDTINVFYKQLPLVWLGNDTTLCENTAILLSAYGANTSFYQWQDNSVTSTLSANKAGIYTVKVTGDNGCINADTIEIKYNALPVFSLGNDTSLCEGQKLTLQVTLNAAQYLWQNGSVSNSFPVDAAGYYWVDVSQHGCSLRDSILVLYKPTPGFNLGNDTTVCEGTIIRLSAFSAGASYRWQDNTSTAQYNVTQPGTYSTVVSLNGCSTTDEITVNYLYKPRFDLGSDTTLCTGQQIVLKVNSGNVSYTWQDGSTKPEFEVRQPGKYFVNVSNSCGNSYDEIDIRQGSCQLFMPSAFTPNNDGINDVFRVKYPAFIKSFHMVIYNRFGERVFETTDKFAGWNGSYKGFPQQGGVYIWMISLTDNDGNKDNQQGTVMLVR